MTPDSVLQLFPLPSQTQPLQGLYLNHQLRLLRSGAPFVYSNFVVSLDGRIGLPHPTDGHMGVPSAIANRRDWRLFQELAAQADIIISSGRYLRDYAHGRAQEILQVYQQPEFADLLAWRLAHGLRPSPDLAVVSGSLDFPVPPDLLQDGRRLYVFTDAQADPERQTAVAGQVSRLFVAPQPNLSGKWLIDQLAQLGYHLIYNSAGPKILHLLLADDLLDRLYLTHAHRLLAGEPFASISQGAALQPAIDMRLQTLYLDAQALDGAGQLFACYQRR